MRACPACISRGESFHGDLSNFLPALCQFHLPTCDSPQHPIPSKSHSQHPLRARCAACRGRVLLLLPSGKQVSRLRQNSWRASSCRSRRNKLLGWLAAVLLFNRDRNRVRDGTFNINTDTLPELQDPARPSPCPFS